MKVKLGIVLLLGILFIGVFFLKGNTCSEQNVFDIAFENLEALSQGEEGTAVGTCYRDGDTPGEFKFRYLCDFRTTDDWIYPCPKTQEFSTFSKSDKCTK